MSDCQSAFEKWYSDNGEFPKAVEKSGGEYRLIQAQTSWIAWQAAWKESERQRQQDGGWLPIDEWHEDIGNAFWAKFPIDEPYYAGSPLDCDWPGYHTHFIPMSVFNHLIDARGELKQPAPKKENDDA